MALYERFVDGAKVARAFTMDGSEEDVERAADAEQGRDGWLRADAAPASSRSRAKKRASEE